MKNLTLALVLFLSALTSFGQEKKDFSSNDKIIKELRKALVASKTSTLQISEDRETWYMPEDMVKFTMVYDSVFIITCEDIRKRHIVKYNRIETEEEDGNVYTFYYKDATPLVSIAKFSNGEIYKTLLSNKVSITTESDFNFSH